LKSFLDGFSRAAVWILFWKQLDTWSTLQLLGSGGQEANRVYHLVNPYLGSELSLHFLSMVTFGLIAVGYRFDKKYLVDIMIWLLPLVVMSNLATLYVWKFSWLLLPLVAVVGSVSYERCKPDLFFVSGRQPLPIGVYFRRKMTGWKELKASVTNRYM